MSYAAACVIGEKSFNISWGRYIIRITFIVISFYILNFIIIQVKNATAIQQYAFEKVMKDSLTGVYNRNMFEEVFKGQVAHTSSQVCVMIDVNEMKEINDNYGHPAGDHVLRNLGNILIKNIRQSDICIRYGGDEFFILFNKININDCQKIIDRIIKIINLKSIYIEDKQIHFSISYGIFQIEKGMPYDKALVEVDKLLYECKKKNKSNQ